MHARFMVHVKRELQARARELRLAGKTYDEIVAELGVSKSSVSLWVRDLPRPKPRWVDVERMQQMHDRLMEQRRGQEGERQRLTDDAVRDVGELSDRELLLVGTALYWAEGQKSKSYSRREWLSFINSDPRMIHVFVRWLEILGVGRDRFSCTVCIHDTADVAEATRYWAAIVGIPPERFRKPSIKKHNPDTNRITRGWGCLRIHVTRSAALYRRVEGWWSGIAKGSGGNAPPGLSGKV